VIIPRLGAEGAAWVSATLAVAGAAASIALFCWLTRVRLPIATVVRSVAFSAICYLLGGLWATAGLLLFVKVAVLSLAVVGLYLVTGELHSSELTMLRAALPQGRAPRS